jgi:hypothetical protein
MRIYWHLHNTLVSVVMVQMEMAMEFQADGHDRPEFCLPTRMKEMSEEYYGLFWWRPA